MSPLSLEAAHVRNLFYYCPDTGVFTRRISRGTARAGAIAGTIHATGYRRIQIDRSLKLAHRVAWLYVYGQWPSDEIDHINGLKDDNRICNLRLATRGQNRSNSKINKNKKLRFKGVYWHEKKKNFSAAIRANKKQYHIGYFKSAEAASRAYAEAALRFHGEFARLS